MPGLKFRVLLDSESNEEVFRDILISDTDNFESLYQSIISSFEFKGDQMASFYVSNDQWDKGHEINLMDMTYDDESLDSPESVMKKAIIKDFIAEPDQKFILIYDFLKMWIFLVELIGYQKENPETPMILLKVGNAPKENSKEIMEDPLYANENPQIDDSDDDELGFNDFEDDYNDDDLTDFNDYEY